MGSFWLRLSWILADSVFWFVTVVEEMAEQIPLGRVELHFSSLQMWLHNLVFTN